MHTFRNLGLALLVVLMSACDARQPANPAPAYRWAPGKAVPTSWLPTIRGANDLRGIVHLHSPLSHDACDGHERAEFTDAHCLADLRHGICATEQDFVFLTDHPAFFEEHEYPETLLYQPGDVLIMQDGKPVANWLVCPSGRRVLTQAGFESHSLMPLAMAEHVSQAVADRKALYDATDVTSVVRIGATTGAAIFIPHTESKDYAWYASLPIVGQEIYNLHANLDPRIRAKHLGLDEAGYLPALLKFTTLDPAGPHPDLSLLAFLTENAVSLAKWDRILQEKRVVGIAGSDAHENVFVNKMRDGERGDSYRRILGFFSNHVLVPSPRDWQAPLEALRALRVYVAFEAFGTPLGFDFHAETIEGIVEMGGEVRLQAQPTLVVRVPSVFGLDPQRQRPRITARLYRVRSDGRELMAQAERELRIGVSQPGIYRVEVHIIPEHVRPDLGTLGDLVREVPWVYGNPIFVRQ